MKKIICLLLITFLAVPLIFARGSSEKNKIVIYTSMYSEVIDAVKSDLNRKFPNYNIVFVQGGTGVIQARVNSEIASGRLGCDILMVAEPSYSLELKEKGLLHPFNYKELSALAFEYDPEGYWYPVRVSNMVLAFNSANNARSAVPNSFLTFANDTRFRNAASMRNPLVSGTTMASLTALRDKYGYDYLESIGRQRVIIDYGTDQTLYRLEAGESRVAMILEESILKVRQEGNTRLEIIYPTDGTVVIPSNIMIVNNRWSANRNIQQAEKVAEWFLGMEGQAAIVAGWMHSVRSDFPHPPNGSVPISEILNNSIPVVWENVFKDKQEIQTRFEEFITRGR